MKASFLILFFFLAIYCSVKGQLKRSDTGKKTNQRTSVQQAHSPIQTVDHMPIIQAEPLKPVTKLADTSKWGVEWVLVFSPLILFFLLLLIVCFWIRKFDLSEALTENDLSTKTKYNKLYDIDNITKLLILNSSIPVSSILPPTIGESEFYRPSISRLIVFITSMLSLILGLCITCFVIYNNLLGRDSSADINKLSNVLLSLGIGVVPYAFNKVATAINSKPTQPPPTMQPIISPLTGTVPIATPIATPIAALEATPRIKK